MRIARELNRLLFGLLVLILVAMPGSQALAAETFRVLASTFPVWIFSRNVCAGVENTRVELLIPALAGCPHDYAPGPADLIKIEKANVMVINGLGLEEGILKARDSVAAKLAVIDAGHDVQPLLTSPDERGHDHQHDQRDTGHKHDGPNPHIFAGPLQAALMVENIRRGLAQNDPANASLYEANAAAYAAKLRILAERLHAIGAAAANKNIALQHDALAYLAQNAALEVVGLLPAMRNPSAAQLRTLQRDFANKKPVIIATDAQYSDKIAMMLAKETGIPCASLNPGANGPADAPLDYYESVMDNNIAVLEKYFK